MIIIKVQQLHVFAKLKQFLEQEDGNGEKELQVDTTTYTLSVVSPACHTPLSSLPPPPRFILSSPAVCGALVVIITDYVKLFNRLIISVTTRKE